MAAPQQPQVDPTSSSLLNGATVNGVTTTITVDQQQTLIEGREKDVGAMEIPGAPKLQPPTGDATAEPTTDVLGKKKRDAAAEEDIGDEDSDTDDDDDDDDEEENGGGEDDDDDDDDDDDEEEEEDEEEVPEPDYRAALSGKKDLSDDEEEFEPNEDMDDEDEEEDEEDLDADDANDSFAVVKEGAASSSAELGTRKRGTGAVASSEEGGSGEQHAGAAGSGSQNGSSKKIRTEDGSAAAIGGGGETTAEQKSQQQQQPASKVQSLLSSLNKKPQQQQSVLDATRQNWEAVKEKDPALKEELESHLKSKDSFLDQQEFLNKVSANTAAVQQAQLNGSPNGSRRQNKQ